MGQLHKLSLSIALLFKLKLKLSESVNHKPLKFADSMKIYCNAKLCSSISWSLKQLDIIVSTMIYIMEGIPLYSTKLLRKRYAAELLQYQKRAKCLE